MTHQQILSELTDAIVKAVPEVRHDEGCIKCGYYLDERPITLEDVLRAFGQKKSMGGQSLSGTLGRERSRQEKLMDIFNRWHLGLSLSQQSEECISFLHSLLCSPK